jgi:DNA-directed RNA polymerase specialized sigma24 family protein
MAQRPHDPVAARLVDPQLTGSLRRYLCSRGIPEGEVDEILGAARMQLLEWGLPQTPVEVDRLLFRFAQRRAMDWHREMKVELLGEGSVTIVLRVKRRCAEPPPPAPPAAEQALRELEQLVAHNPRHARAFEAVRQKMAGKSLEQYAAESGVPAGTLRQWVNRFRAHACRQMSWCVDFF